MACLLPMNNSIRCNKAISQGSFPMIDMRNNRNISNFTRIFHEAFDVFVACLLTYHLIFVQYNYLFTNPKLLYINSNSQFCLSNLLIINNMEKQSRALVKVENHTIDSLSPGARKFYQFHGVQMLGSEFPTHLIEKLYLKLIDNSYDGGDFLEVLDNQQAQKYEVRATQHLQALGNVFIVDHALTFRYPQLRKILKQNPQVIGRLQIMLKYYQQQKKLLNPVGVTVQSNKYELQLQNMDLLEVSNLEFPSSLVTLSLINNRLENVDELINKIKGLNLKGFWVNENPLASNEKLKQFVEKQTKIQIFNGKFTKNCTDWGVKYTQSKNVTTVANVVNSQIYRLNLDGRNIFDLDFSILESFSSMRSLSIKNNTFQGKEEFLLKLVHLPKLLDLYTDEQLEIQIREEYKKGNIKPQVADRLLINKHSLKQELNEGDRRIDAICNSIFRLAGCYRLASTQQLDQSSCWYINDQLGSFISHSDHPNVKIIPFLFAPNNKLDQHVVSFSLIWPLVDIKMGDQITRDFLNGFTENRQRSSRLAAWYKLPQTYYQLKISQFNKQMANKTAKTISLLQQFQSNNSLKQKQNGSKVQKSQRKLHVISDYEYINKYLKHQKFQIVNSLQTADIVWLVAAAEQQEWKKYKGKFYLNQFPFESCIVLKNNLANTVQTVLGNTNFLQRTYDLEKELTQFVGDYYSREKQGSDNLWILKPPNMARSMDMIITDNLPLIIRNMETGPKIAQKYISKPVLRRGRKVDLRYILLVKSITPLSLFLYKNFWIRSANNDYTVDRRHLSTYETQFTVMNYGKVSNFQQIKYKDFIEQFQKDYSLSWSVINERIKKMLRDVFIAVATKYPEMHDDKSRAYYGIDIMVDSETMEPKLLEITFSPDCKRACEYYPTFYDEIFQTLFLETVSENMQKII